MPTVKLQDIARICGVDISTVSRGMRGDPRVKPATRKQIQRTADRLGYLPNLLARNLAGGKTRTIWLILPSVDASIDHRLVRHASHHANDLDYTLFVGLHDSDNFGMLANHTSDHYEQVVQKAAQGTVDGVVVVPRRGVDDTDLLKGLVRKDFPLVFLDNYIEALPCPAFTTDNEIAASELARRSVEAGATGAVLLFNEPNPVARARLAGAGAILRELGVPFIAGAKITSSIERLGPSVAVIGSSQSHINPSVISHAPQLAEKRLLFGVFDEWVGEPSPAEKVFMAVQDCDTLAKLAIERLIAIIEKQQVSGPRITRIPILEFVEKSASFASDGK